MNITSSNFPKKVYIGLTKKEFKTRWNGHKQSFNNHKKKKYIIIFLVMGP